MQEQCGRLSMRATSLTKASVPHGIVVAFRIRPVEMAAISGAPQDTDRLARVLRSGGGRTRHTLQPSTDSLRSRREKARPRHAVELWRKVRPSRTHHAWAGTNLKAIKEGTPAATFSTTESRSKLFDNLTCIRRETGSSHARHADLHNCCSAKSPTGDWLHMDESPTNATRTGSLT